MIIATTFAGSLPKLIPCHNKIILKLVGGLGNGLCIGAALTIVLPEGISALYDSMMEIQEEGGDCFEAHHMVSNVGVAIIAGFLFMMFIDKLT